MAQAIIADKFYVLTPAQNVSVATALPAVDGPFDTHQAARLARETWAIKARDAADRGEILTGAQLANDYQGKYGTVH